MLPVLEQRRWHLSVLSQATPPTRILTRTHLQAPARAHTVKQVCQDTRAHSKATHNLLIRPRSYAPRLRYCPRAWRSSTADVDFEEGLLRYQNVSNPSMYPICFARPTWYSQSLTASSCLATPSHLMLSTPTANNQQSVQRQPHATRATRSPLLPPTHPCSTLEQPVPAPRTANLALVRLAEVVPL